VALRNPEQPHFFFIHEHFQRFLMKGHKREGAWYYFLVLLIPGILPWIGVLPQSLAAAFKRVVNIIKEAETTPVQPELLQNAAEQALFNAFKETEGAVEACLARSDYDGALEAMARLKEFIDGFFDSVLVMDSDEGIRRNRIGLLTRIRDLFAGVADFEKSRPADRHPRARAPSAFPPLSPSMDSGRGWR